MEYERNTIMSIAGLDPSAGAGLLADVKTFEQHHCLGFGVASALTVQTENQFYGLHWLSLEQIQAQAEPLIKTYNPPAVKIGIIQNLEVMNQLTIWLKTNSPALKIIWDPVLASSSGFIFISEIERDMLYEILGNIYLLTPNTSEAKSLTARQNEEIAAKNLSKYCHVLLKGGHSENDKGTDILYSEGEIFSFSSPSGDLPSKHGSGCILSSAIAANIANGLNLKEACLSAKQYIEKILKSNSRLLAYHA